MHIEKIKYTAQYEAGRKVAEWIGLDAAPDAGETADEAYKATLDQVGKWYQLANPENVLPGQQGPPGELPTINRAEERLIGLIEEAPTVDLLRNYAKDCKSSASQEAYALRYKILTNT